MEHRRLRVNKLTELYTREEFGGTDIPFTLKNETVPFNGIIEFEHANVNTTGNILLNGAGFIIFSNGILHCDIAPAVSIEGYGYLWYKNGICHREDGPAIIFTRNSVGYMWALNGLRYNDEKEWKLDIRKLKLEKFLDDKS